MVINHLVNSLKEIIEQNPNADSKFETDQLIEFVTGKKRINFLPAQEMPQEQADRIINLANKRKDGYPLQYILGCWQFFDMDLQVGEGVLIPRQDTETVCEAAFEIINKIASPAVMDLCAGSGAIALAIKKYCPRASVVAIEKYPKAFQYLKKNIESTGLQVMPVMADIFRFDEYVENEAFDVIISNPPYINPALKGSMQKEVTFEPEEALFADNSGLRFYKFIAEFYRDKIKEKGYLIFEYGYDQKDKVRDILTNSGYGIVREIIDLQGNPRGVIATR